jgi:hypothetical protein
MKTTLRIILDIPHDDGNKIPSEIWPGCANSRDMAALTKMQLEDGEVTLLELLDDETIVTYEILP